MINANREVVIKDKEFITSTETSSTIIITRDQVWPRVSIPCFYRHPPHVLYFCIDVSYLFQVSVLSLRHMPLHSHLQKHSHAKRYQRKHSIRTGRYSCTFTKKTL